MIDNYNNLISKHESISLKQMSDYKLLNRVDTKFICNIQLLPEIIKQSIEQFKVQEINGSRVSQYESLYFDTPEFKSYFDHHQGKRLRYKIRFRKYIDTGDSFLEIKKKQSYTRTDKRRSAFEITSNMNNDHFKFINKHIAIPETGLQPTIWTLFNRTTLVGKNHLERVTIDTDVKFKDFNSKLVHLPNAAIIEVKRQKSSDLSPFIHILKNLGLRSFGISKYILGNISLYPQIKHNRFHNKIVTVNKICHGTKFSY